MTRAGLRTEPEYFGSLSSLEVWNNSNSGVNPGASTVSYYNKGHVMGLLLDARVRRAAGGRASLDDVMRLAYRRHSGAGAGVAAAGSDGCRASGGCRRAVALRWTA